MFERLPAPLERTVRVIGIGPGGWQSLTSEAAAAIASSDVFLVLDKGDRQREMLELRQRLIDDHGRGDARVIEIADTRRDAEAPYGVAVADWHAEVLDPDRRG